MHGLEITHSGQGDPLGEWQNVLHLSVGEFSKGPAVVCGIVQVRISSDKESCHDLCQS